MNLTEQQVRRLESLLREGGIRKGDTFGELLDHLCCATEHHMAQGMGFDEATHQAMSDFGRDNLTIIRRHRRHLIIHKNKRHMKRIVLLIVLLGGVAATFGYHYSRDSGTPDMVAEAPSPLPPSEAKADEPPAIPPIQGDFKVASGFGMKRHPIHKVKRMHKGIDLAAPTGTIVIAPADGIVTKAAYDELYGYHLEIMHDGRFTSFYAHLLEIDVKEGQAVAKGQGIAKVGSTGRSTAPHLHYEVIKDGKHVDPKEYGC